MRRRILPALLLLSPLLLMVQALFHWRAEALFPSYISALPANPGSYPTLFEQIERLQRCVALQPANADYRLLLAERLLLRSGLPGRTPESQQADWEEARREIAQALRLNPIDPRGQVLLGQYLLKKGKTEQALASLRRAVALAPNKGQIHGYLGAALAQAAARNPHRPNRLAYAEEGKDSLGRAVELDPSLAQQITFLSSLADLHLTVGDQAEALRTLQRVSTLPHGQEALPSLVKLASLYLQRGQAARAVSIYRSLLARPDLAWQRATLEAEMERASLFYPSAWPLQQLLGDLAASRQDWVGAAQHYRRWVSLQPQSPEAHFQLGLAYEKLGKTDLSMAQYENTLRLNPHHSGATQKIIEHYKR